MYIQVEILSLNVFHYTDKLKKIEFYWDLFTCLKHGTKAYVTAECFFGKWSVLCYLSFHISGSKWSEHCSESDISNQ